MKSHFSFLRVLSKINKPPILYSNGFFISFILILCCTSINGYSTNTSTDDSKTLLCPNSADFIFTRVLCIDGAYSITVVPVNSGTHIWAATISGGTPSTSTSASPTFVLGNTSNYITVSHRITIDGVTTVCSQSFNIICRSSCDSLEFDNNVINCTNNFSLPHGIYNGTIVWDFGDGSTTSSSSGYISHHYSSPGTYTVCLTQVYGENIYSTCCQDVTVESCSITCDSTVLTDTAIIQINRGNHCVVTLNFSPYISSFYTWDFGDGSAPETTTVPTVDHNYIGDGPFTICVKFLPSPSTDTLTCCFVKNFPKCACCDTSDFSIDPVNGSSCLMPVYEIIPSCLNTGFVSHEWIFSDGTIEYTADTIFHIFTNFVDSTGQVCVTHITTCDTIVKSTTHCISHYPGAYLGYGNSTTKMTDHIHSPWGPKVYDFIHKYSNTPSIPLLIDGLLIVDTNLVFSTGTWYMGYLSQILDNNHQFDLNNTTIESAFRLGKDCCRWKGIESWFGSTLTWNGASILDAQTMLNFPFTSNFKPPKLDFRDCHFIQNQWGIVSDRMPFKVNYFSNNEFIGGQHDTYCDCVMNNCIELKNITTGITFPNTGTKNKISLYEEGFHCLNTSLTVYNFDVFKLGDMTGINPPPFDGIGIYFNSVSPKNSKLSMDYMSFDSIQIGVKEIIEKSGTHTLTANASVPLTSLWMKDVSMGYDILLNNSQLKGSIYNNKIHTNGGDNNFGIKANMQGTSDNILNVKYDSILISGGNLTSMGISIVSKPQSSQKVNIESNKISAGALNTGACIDIGATRNSYINQNSIYGFNPQNGIGLKSSPFTTITCNYIGFTNFGILLNLSQNIKVQENYIDGNKTGLNVLGDCQGVNGTVITKDTFNSNYTQAIHYNNDGITGQQHHVKYNSWFGQKTFDINHDNSDNSLFGRPYNCQFWFPSGVSSGSEHRPAVNRSRLMASHTGSPDYTIHCFDLTIADPGNQIRIDSLPADTSYARIVRDTNLLTELSTAEYASMEQSVWEFLDENPSAATSSTTLGNFLTAHSSDFIGKSMTLRKRMKLLRDSIDVQLITLHGLKADRDTLIDSLKVIYTNADTVVTPYGLASLTAAMTAIISDITVLDASIETIQTDFDTYNNSSFSGLVTYNNSLPFSLLYENYERIVNGYIIKTWQGDTLTTDEQDTLRNIAQTCYVDGGQSVILARNLCLMELNEYYENESCSSPLIGEDKPIEERAINNLNQNDVIVSPNPVNNQLKISFSNNRVKKTPVLDILDSSGRIIETNTKWLNINDCVIDVSNFYEGLYIIRIVSQDKIYTAKFVVKH